MLDWEDDGKVGLDWVEVDWEIAEWVAVCVDVSISMDDSEVELGMVATIGSTGHAATGIIGR